MTKNRTLKTRDFILLTLICTFFEGKSQEIVTFYPTDIVIENEILIPVGLKDEENYSKIIDLADSIIPSAGYTRKYLDIDIGKENIDFEPDQQIILFDKFNDIIGIGIFSHFEHFDEGSGMGFTFFSATFKITGKKVESKNISYCVNNVALKYFDNSIKLKVIDPFIIPRSTKELLDFNLTYEDYISYWSPKDSAKLALISVETTKIGDEDRSFKYVIYDGINDQNLKVFELDSGPYNISNFLVTKIMYNSKPIIICEVGIPNSDITGFDVLVWSNNGYTISDYSIEY